ncbi:MAG: sensor histidine kinase [Candidatus Hodarchaeota archaeon]
MIHYEIIVSVKDNGIGFTREEKKNVFQKFGKINRDGLGWDIISEGSGLGLYIAKMSVELHGGKMWLDSNGKNQGSTFYFSLPFEIPQ